MRRPLLMFRTPNAYGPFWQPFGSKLVHTLGNYFGLNKLKPWTGTEPYCCMDFTQATIEPAAPNPNGVTTQFLRASEATVEDYQGNLVTVPIDTPRFQGARWDGSQWHGTTPEGAPIRGITYLNEPAATNYFLNSDAPVTQTISGLLGDHTFWLVGSGSITLSGGAMGVVTEGNPVTAAVSGNVLCTISGTVERVQVEGNTVPTSYIPTAGGAVTREADDLRYIGGPTAEVSIQIGFESDAAIPNNNDFRLFGSKSSDNNEIRAAGANNWNFGISAGGFYQNMNGIAAGKRVFSGGYENGNQQAYLDGGQRNAQAEAWSPSHSNQYIRLGRWGNFFTRAPLRFSTFKLWNLALPGDELQALSSQDWNCSGA